MIIVKDKITPIVLRAVGDLAQELNIKDLVDPSFDTIIYSQESSLGSMELVSLIADIEQLVKDELGADIVLADERAMSQKHSPFKNIQSLVEYTRTLVEEGSN